MARRHTVCAVIALAFASLAFAETPARVEAPKLKKGDSWTYVTTNRWNNEEQSEDVGVVTEADQMQVRIRWKDTISGRSAETLSTGELNYVERGIVRGKPRVRIVPHDYAFSFPLEIGKTWKGTLTTDIVREGRQVRSDVAARVIGWETVKTPAGTFEALKIEKTGYYQRLESNAHLWSGNMKWTYWYAPAVKRSVRVEYEDIPSFYTGGRYKYTLTELVSYELAK